MTLGAADMLATNLCKQKRAAVGLCANEDSAVHPFSGSWRATRAGGAQTSSDGVREGRQQRETAHRQLCDSFPTATLPRRQRHLSRQRTP